MKNIDRIAQLVTKHGATNVLVHSIPKSQEWIICQKVEENKWILTLCNPMKNITYNLGMVSNEEHLNLWQELMHLEIGLKISAIKRAQEIRRIIRNFLKRTNNYEKFIDKKKTKQNRTKLRRRNERFQKIIARGIL